MIGRPLGPRCLSGLSRHAKRRRGRTSPLRPGSAPTPRLRLVSFHIPGEANTPRRTRLERPTPWISTNAA